MRRFAEIHNDRVHSIIEREGDAPAFHSSIEIVEISDQPDVGERWLYDRKQKAFARPPDMPPSPMHRMVDGKWVENAELKAQMEAAKQAREELETLMRATDLSTEERLDRMERVLAERLGVGVGAFHPDNSGS